MIFCIQLLSILRLIISSSAGECGSYVSYEQKCAIPALSASINDFGAILTQELDGTDNLFISPMSIFTALSMIYLGTEGQTAQEMECVLQLTTNGLDHEQLPRAFKSLLDKTNNSNGEYALSLANGMFLQRTYEVNTSYVSNIRNFYDALFRLVDFKNEHEGTRNEINEFVEKNTRGKINNVLKEPLDPLTVLTLVNAIYFKGIWNTQFSKTETKKGTFYLNENSTKQVEFMQLRKQKFRYLNDFATTKFKFLEMPYKGNDISMILALPNKNNQTLDLKMTSDLLCRLNSSMRNIKTNYIIIPKFQLKYHRNLVDSLKKLGIIQLFNEEANLTGISSDGKIKVTDVIHDAVIDVNEEGSEAAAFSRVSIRRKSKNRSNFIANRPFSIFIMDKRSSLILFSGIVTNP